MVPVTGYTLTQPEVWYAGPIAYQAAGNATAGWVQAAAASVVQQSLVTAATGASGAAGATQPFFPAGFWQKQGQVAKIILHGNVTTQATTTTATFSVGTSSSTPQGTATTITIGNGVTLFTSPAYPNQGVAQTNAPFHFDLDLLCTKVGVGTTAVSTSILTTGIGGYTPAIVPAVGSVPTYGPVPGNVITTFDSSVNQFIWVAVTFSTSSATNTCTLLSCYVYGMN